MGSQLPFKNLKERAENILKQKTILPIQSKCNVDELTYELNLYQTELEVLNEDLMDSFFELEKTKDKYQKLFELAPIAYFTLDENGLILEVNKAGQKLLGVSKETLINKSFVRYITPDFQHVFSHHRKNILNQDQLDRCEIKLLKKNGSIFFCTNRKSKTNEYEIGRIANIKFCNGYH